MAQTAQHTQPAVPYALLVTFSWGDSTVARYTTWPTDIAAGDTFTAAPAMDVKFTTPLQFGTKDAEVEITIPSSFPPATTLKRPFKHAKVKVKIEEIVPGDLSSRRILFWGSVKRSRASSERSGGLVKLLICGLKSRLTVAKIGMQALSTCLHTFGGPLCGFDLPANTLTGTIIELNRDGIFNRVRVSFTGSPIVTGDRFAAGFIEVDALRLGIRAVLSTGDNVASFDLRSLPPPEWLNATAKVAPGCQKTLLACRDPFRDRETQFLAPGIAMPNFNPAFSDDPNT